MTTDGQAVMTADGQPVMTANGQAVMTANGRPPMTTDGQFTDRATFIKATIDDVDQDTAGYGTNGGAGPP